MTLPKDPIKTAEYLSKMREYRSTKEYKLECKIYMLLSIGLGNRTFKSNLGSKRTYKVNQAVPTKCGVCQQIFPTRSEMCKHKYTEHEIIRSKPAKLTCKTCLGVFSDWSALMQHKLTIHREEFFPDCKSGTKPGTKFSVEHKHNLSKSLRIHHGTHDPDRPLGPAQSHTPFMEDRWCHDYDVWMTAVKKRDNYTCRHCGRGKKDGIRVIAHHIIPYKPFPATRYVVENGLTLCDSCHITEENRLKVQRADARQFISQLVLCSNSKSITDILFTSVGKIYFDSLNKRMVRGFQKKHPEMNQQSCYEVIDQIQLFGTT
jgi:HNH endonuclease